MSSRRLSDVLSPKARADVEDILAFGVREWGELNAASYESALERALANLSEFPEMGRARDDLRPGCRGLAVEHHVILYRADEYKVEIVRIVHRKADIGRQLGDR